MEENSSEKKDVLTFAQHSQATAWKHTHFLIAQDHFHLHNLHLNLINSTLRELESDLCSKEVTLQESFFFKIQWKDDLHFQTDEETLQEIGSEVVKSPDLWRFKTRVVWRCD